MTELARPAIHRVETARVVGWLVIDAIADGLAFGGCRFSPDVTEAEVAGLARCMSYKLAGHGLPVGGAKAGLRCDPRDPGLPDALAEVAAAWSEPLSKTAMIGKDLGATDALLDALYAHLGKPQMHLVMSCKPGVPGRLRDLQGYRSHMTGLGVAWATLAACHGRVDGQRVVIQGFGAVGCGSAVRLTDLGARVAGASDRDGWVRFGPDVDYAALRTASGSISRRGVDPSALASDRDTLFAESADILVLAATSFSVTDAIARRIAAPLVIEGANMAITPSARRILRDRGVVVIPDIIASSSSAAMVAHQMASADTLEPDVLWDRIRGAIEVNAARCAEIERKGGDGRADFIARMRTGVLGDRRRDD